VGSDVRLPAGDTKTSDPRFTRYYGVNTGPYFSFPNDTRILPPVPIEWIIAPTNVTDGQCPTRSENLALFGIINIIVAAAVLLFGCRPLIHFLTGGFLGRPGKSRSAFWTWIFSFGLQVGSNAVVSKLIVDTPGYEHLSMLNIFALYSSRPRANFLWLAFLRVVVGPITIERHLRFINFKEKETRTLNIGGRQHIMKFRSGRALLPEWIYTDAYAATAICEFFIQLISAIFVGVTWKRFPNEVIKDHMKTNVNLLLAAPAMVLIGMIFVPFWTRRNEPAIPLERNPPTGSYCSNLAGYIFIAHSLIGLFTYAVVWWYWSEFLGLPGAL